MSSKPGKTADLTYTKEKEPLIGGPETVLPFAVESFLAWSLAITCLAVSGYHYVGATFVLPILTRLRILWTGHSGSDDNERKNALPCWLPLTTHSRSELDRATPLERCHQLVLYLMHATKQTSWTDENLVQLIRSNEICRRLASLAMRPTEDVYNESVEQVPIRQQLIRAWPALLTLPPLGEGYKFDISIIVPAYRERGSDVRAKLKRASDSCRHPKKVQVVLVNAGNNGNLAESVQELMDCWGELKIVEFTAGGGRGPCLNYGASFATGRLYSFCHSDTMLPKDWDTKVVATLCGRHNGGMTRANSCAFSFGIDTSDAGLNGGPYPPGIKAVETTANLRSHLYSLPYGDQVLSIPAAIFDYLGGFPDQCLMEDYELISILRRRAALLPKFGILDRERLVIISEAAALCSPRRWQKFGVLYVTFMNSKFVNMYVGGMRPNDLFHLYYGRPPPIRQRELGTWENEMEEFIHNK